MKKERTIRIPTQARAINTRNKIIQSGRVLFREKGYHHINAIDIANHAGVATGTLYTYFNNKKEILIECIRLFYCDITGLITSVEESIDYNRLNSRNFVRFFVSAFHAALGLNPEFSKELSAMILLDKSIEKVCHGEDRKIILFIARFLEKNASLFQITDYEGAATLIYRICVDTMMRLNIFEHELEEERILKELTDMLYKYLTTSMHDSTAS
jgi:AcrR family transcriptional regulator